MPALLASGIIEAHLYGHELRALLAERPTQEQTHAALVRQVLEALVANAAPVRIVECWSEDAYGHAHKLSHDSHCEGPMDWAALLLQYPLNQDRLSIAEF